MKAYLPFIVIGLSSGSVYALAAMGLVTTYTTSGVFNFAHGAIGMFVTFVFYTLRVEHGTPTALAVAICVLLVAPLIGLILDRGILRRLSGAPPVAYVVASLGLLVALQGLALEIWGARSRQLAPLFPTSTFKLGDVYVGYDQLFVVVIALASLIALVLFFRATHLGLQTRAVVDDPELCELTGTDARRVTTFSWMLGSAFAALSGILLAPVVGLDAAILTLLVLQAFGAAVVGRLTSLPLTYFGALAIGIGAALSTKFVADIPQLAGFPSSLPFIVLFGVLVIGGRRQFQEMTPVRRLATAARTRGRPQSSPIGMVVILAVAASVPLFTSGSRLAIATAALAFVLVYASLGFLIGVSGQVSLCHAIFVGLGATTLSHLTDAGVPFVIALPLAGLIMAPIAAVVALPAIRLSGLFLALATFGFGVLVQSLVFVTSLGFGREGLVSIPRPSIFGWTLDHDVPFYYFVLFVVAGGVGLLEVVNRTRLGRLLRALADSPTAVESIGISPLSARVLAFALSGALAAVAGGLLGSLYTSINTVSFDYFQSLLWVTVLVTMGAATFGGAAMAAVFAVAVPSLFDIHWLVSYQPIIFGVAAMLYAQAPNGAIGMMRLPDFGRLAKRSAWRADDGAHGRNPSVLGTATEELV